MNKEAIKYQETRKQKDFTPLYNKTAHYLKYFLWNRFKNIPQGVREDVINDTLYIAWNRIDMFDSNKASFRTWITQICINETITWWKKNKRIPMGGYEEAVYKMAYEEDDTEKADMLNALSDCVQDMPDKYKYVIQRVYIDGAKGKDVAKEMGLKESTFKTRMRYAKAYLKKNVNYE